MNLEFDKCPKCGAEPTFGLRCHPKWSVKVGILLPNFADLTAFYAHDGQAAAALYHSMVKAGHDVISFEHWDGTSWKELPPPDEPRNDFADVQDIDTEGPGPCRGCDAVEVQFPETDLCDNCQKDGN